MQNGMPVGDDWDKWAAYINFAGEVLGKYIPANARVRAEAIANWEWTYIPWQTAEPSFWEAMFTLNNPPNTWWTMGGNTYVAQALRNVLDNALDAESQTRKTIFVLIVGDNPNDFVAPLKPQLSSAGIEIVVVGVGSLFRAKYYEDIVSDEYAIIEVPHYQNLSLYTERVGQYICSETFTLEMTEIKPEGSEQFIEFVNTGIGTPSDGFRIFSTILPNENFTFPNGDNWATSDRVVVSQSAEPFCNSTVNCHNYIAPGTWNSVLNWTFQLAQVGVSNGQEYLNEVNTSISRAQLGPDLVTLSSNEYSYERILGYDYHYPSSYRRSCFPNGSPGEPNAAVCTYPCTDNSDCGGSNTCDSMGVGCICQTGYMQEPSSCPVIPPVPSCTVTGILPGGVTEAEATDKFQTLVTWERSAADYVGGYKINFESGTKEFFQWTLDQEAQILMAPSDWTGVVIYAIGGFVCSETTPPGGNTGNTNSHTQNATSSYYTCQQIVDRISFGTTCSAVYNSSIPSASPSTTVPSAPPTAAPSFSPSVEPSYKPSVVPSLGPTFAPSVEPSKSPSVSPSEQPTEIPSLNPTTTQPSKMPNWEHPEAYVYMAFWNQGGYMRDSAGKVIFNTTYFTSLQDIIVELRIINSPQYQEITVYWGLFENVNGTEVVLHNGSHTFPPSATIVADSWQRNFGKFPVALGAPSRELVWRVVKTNETDPFGRELYDVAYPEYANIIITHEAAPILVEESPGETETLPWWVYAIIAVAVLAICIIAGYYANIQKKQRQKAEEKEKDAIEAYKEDVGGQFFKNAVGVTHNFKLKQLKDQQAMTKMNSKREPEQNFEMIQYAEDDEHFDFRESFGVGHTTAGNEGTEPITLPAFDGTTVGGSGDDDDWGRTRGGEDEYYG